MNCESKGIELNIIKGIMRMRSMSSVSSYRNIITCLDHLLYYNNYTGYNIDKINFVIPRFGVTVCGMNKNGKETKLTQRTWGRKDEK